MTMVDYKNIRNIADIDRERELLRARLKVKESRMASGFMSVKESLAPANLIAQGLKSVSAFVPIDRIVLAIVRFLKRKLTR